MPVSRSLEEAAAVVVAVVVAAVAVVAVEVVAQPPTEILALLRQVALVPMASLLECDHPLNFSRARQMSIDSQDLRMKTI